MDPVALATVTAAVTTMATDVARDLADEAGKGLWLRVKKMLGWSDDPAPEDLAVKIAEDLQRDPDLMKQLIALLQQEREAGGTSAALVGRIDAEKVIVISGQQIAGDFNITM